jgi:hypothetical protein
MQKSRHTARHVVVTAWTRRRLQIHLLYPHAMPVSTSMLLSDRPSARLSVRPSVHLSICLSVCPTVHPSVCLSVCLSVWKYKYSFINPALPGTVVSWGPPMRDGQAAREGLTPRSRRPRMLSLTTASTSTSGRCSESATQSWSSICPRLLVRSTSFRQFFNGTGMPLLPLFRV